MPDVAPSLKQQLSLSLAELEAQAVRDPFSNAHLRFALQLSRQLEDGEVTLEAIGDLVTELAADAFLDRCGRLALYLGDCRAVSLRGRLETLFTTLSADGDFDAYVRRLGATPFGVVLTAHPTFALNHTLSQVMVELATGMDADGEPLSAEARADRLDTARTHVQGPPAELTLDVEHAWSLEALTSAHRALAEIYEIALEVARKRWPRRWSELTPRLVTLASWVGFDQDGRTDVTWQVSLGKRLELKIAALERRREVLTDLCREGEGEWLERLGSALHLVTSAARITREQLAALQAAGADPARAATFSRALVQGRRGALVDVAPLMRRLDDALDSAPDDGRRARLLILRASIATEGASLCRIHVRLNAGQLHNAIRPDVGLESSPTDPANRRTYFAAIDSLIAGAAPVEINLGDLMEEPASARRLMMTLAQMRKYVDASTPVRFLIAETETGFTLLTALYFARLFGVEDHVEISPLFETQEALDRGEKVIEEALRSRHFRDYLQRHGRLAIEFGFSDSGRFIGQLAATFRIERLRFRLAELMAEQGLANLEIIFFNTHGESVGRGGHPSSLADRFRYAAPPRSRQEFERIGVRVKEEDAFQGGEGFLPLLTAPAALATLTTALESVLLPDPEADGDPIYDDPDFASEFFATLEQDFSSLVADPDYAALVGLFGTHLLPKTGSRPVQRQAGDGGRPRTLASVSELRAIPNNGVLQQLGYLANSLYGLGRAAEKDRATFHTMRERSPRFSRAIALAQGAAERSELAILEAYAATLSPSLWLARASEATEPTSDLALANLAEAAALGEAIARVRNRLKAEDVRIRAAGVQTVAGERLELLHAIRLALIQRSDRLIVQTPDFNPRGDITRAAIQERLLRLDIPSALAKLTEYFPRRGDGPVQADFGEVSSYAQTASNGYQREHETVFEPLAALFSQMIAVSHAITHEVGACG